MSGHWSWGPRLAAALVLAGAAVLWASGAQAEPSATVVFTGGCASELVGPQDAATPDPRHASVSAGAQVRLVNRLGRSATVILDGEPAAELPSMGAVDLVFHSGPVTATLEISCAGQEVSGTAAIDVVQGGPGGPQPAGDASTDQSGSPDEEELSPGVAGPSSPAASASSPAGEPAAAGAEAAEGQVPAATTAGSGDGPNGVLALGAAACVAGVLAAAIRSVAARRPARAEWT
jgi:hypothetical protein